MSNNFDLSQVPPRDLDAMIVKDVFGWKETDIPPDAHGQNACVVLTDTGKLPDRYQLPPLGKLHYGFFAPEYSSNWDHALSLASYTMLEMPAHLLFILKPRGIAEAAYMKFINDKKARGEVQ